MALTNMGFKTKNWSHLVGEQIEKGEEKRRGRGRRRREDEEEGDQAKRHGN